MKLLVFLFIVTVQSLCSDLNKYHQPVMGGLKINCSSIPKKSELQNFLERKFSLHDPVLSSYFAYETRFIADHVECFNNKDQVITYSVNGSIYISEIDRP